MKNDKKYLLVGIAFTLLFVLTGCGSGTYGSTNDGNVLITEARAREIALEQVPGSTAEDIVEWDKDNDRGNIKYECEILYQGQEYDFEIDAADGSILGWSVETY